jgi:hypothetical protein
MSVKKTHRAGHRTNGIKYDSRYTAYSAGMKTVGIDNQIVIRVRECVVKSLHRDSPVLSNIASLPDRRPTALVFHIHKRRGSIAVAVRIGFRIECLISAEVADDPGALVGESCEGQSLPYVQDFLAVYFVA